jgi:tRNA pseudouridine38-40 synthase
VRREGDWVIMNIEANAFLLHMVRNIASALHQVGQGAGSGFLRELLLRRDRQELGITGPAPGLYLAEVSYPGYDFPAPPRVPLIRHR